MACCNHCNKRITKLEEEIEFLQSQLEIAKEGLPKFRTRVLCPDKIGEVIE